MEVNEELTRIIAGGSGVRGGFGGRRVSLFGGDNGVVEDC